MAIELLDFSDNQPGKLLGYRRYLRLFKRVLHDRLFLFFLPAAPGKTGRSSRLDGGSWQPMGKKRVYMESADQASTYVCEQRPLSQEQGAPGLCLFS